MKNGLDKRISYRMVVDVETSNSLEDACVYDLGIAICDKRGRIYEEYSLVISDIFYGEKEMMNTAYYVEKLPQYHKQIWSKERTVVTFFEAKQLVRTLCREYDIASVYAYNASFDRAALNTTQRWLTSSKYRYFFPYGVEVKCIWHMACQVFGTRKTFIQWAIENGFVSSSGNIQTSAEIMYRYLTQDVNFVESHTGLEDVHIECAIMARCEAAKRKMARNISRLCWKIPQQARKELGIDILKQMRYKERGNTK